MTRRIEDALETCLQAMRSGASLEAALDLFPEIRHELRPLLETAHAAESISARGVPRHAVVRSRTRMLQRAHSLKPQRSGRGYFPRLIARPAMAVLVVGLSLAAGVGVMGAAAARSLPGDALYPAKLLAEDVLLQLATDPASRLRLEEAYSEQRVEEVRRLLSLGRVASVSFVGLVEATTTDGYVVAGIPVRTAPDTRFVGDIRLGAVIEVEGLTQADGSVLAHELHLQAFDFFGEVESISAEAWVISGLRLAVTPDSVVERGVQVGDRVVVRVLVDDTGLLAIERLELFSPPTPTPAPIPPTPTPTASPSSTPTPRPSPTPSDDNLSTDEPDETDEPNETDEAQEEVDSGGSFEEREFTGVVQTIGSTQWTIGGEVVHIDGNSEIRDDPEIGDDVKVRVEQRSDGLWWVERIELDD